MSCALGELLIVRSLWVEPGQGGGERGVWKAPPTPSRAAPLNTHTASDGPIPKAAPRPPRAPAAAHPHPGLT